MPVVNGAKDRKRIAIVGCGHVGLVTAAGLAALGHTVTGVDVDRARVSALQRGTSPFWEAGLEALLKEQLAAGRLRFTCSYDDAVESAAAVLLCVHTPGLPSGATDLRFLREATGQVAAALVARGGRPLLINKSTAPIGTAETIEVVLRRVFAGTGLPLPKIAANPEFLRQGSAVEDFFRPKRIVVGAKDAAVGRAVAELYAGIDAPVILTDIRAAEMIKYAANSFLAARVSFINELARLCEALDVDVGAVVDGVALDDRIGRAMFQPGVGFGGSCLPKDVAALRHTGECAGVPMRILEAVHEVNASQKTHIVNVARSLLGRLDGKAIAAWGVTFKGGTEDLRDSPALDVIGLLRNEGARISAYDPSLREPLATSLVDETSFDALACVAAADALVVLSDWPEFAGIPVSQIAGAMPGRFVIDGRNLLDPTACAGAGLVYRGVGRPAREQPA